MIYVIGSGPAGVACAHALVRRGAAVTMLDAGAELEPERQSTVARLGAGAPDKWDPADLAAVRRPTEASSRTIPLKAAYGSLFPYRQNSRHLTIERRGVDASPSFALGGLSNVWGATVLPYHQRDITDWPIGIDELAPHYAAAARIMNVSEGDGRLTREFPLFAAGSSALKASRQAEALMRDLDANAAPLEAAGWSFGYSRLAVRDVADNAGQGCMYCGMCLYGCPYGLIYNAASTLAELRRHANFSYRPDVVVTRVTESRGGVRVYAETASTGAPLSFDGDRVCLAAGTFNTTAILLASLEAYDQPVRIQDSQIFLLPLLRYRGTAGVVDEPLHTLTQIFIEVLDPTLLPGTIHLQVYTYNDWYAGVVRRKAGAMYPIARPWVNALLGRLLVMQGYLPSAQSPHITATLRSGERAPALVLEAGEPDAGTQAIRRIVTSIVSHRRHLRAKPLTPLLEIGTPGRGYHTGGSFPMRARPGTFETDRWGRPSGFERVHAVDSTIFPSIPAAPITFTAAANAHRIGSAVAEG